MLRLIFLAVLAGLSRASDVIDYTDDDFESKIGDHELMLVEFFAPWCGHCKRLAPEYEKAATVLKGIVPLAKVDCTASSGTCSKYGVTGYPTLKIFRDGEVTGSYDGPRSADGISSYFKKQAGPASVELKDEEHLQSFISDMDASIVGFFADDKSSAQAEFLKAASALRDKYRFAHTNSEAVLQNHDIDGEGVILFRPRELANKFEDSSVKYSEDKYSSSKIKKFIQDNIYGICPVMNQDNKDELMGKDLVLVYFDVDYVRNPKGSNYWRNRVMKVARSFLDEGKKINFAVADRNEFGGMLTEYGLDPQGDKDKPLVTIHTTKGVKYAMTEKFSVENLHRFLDDYFSGDLKPYLKSEPIPEDNDGPVKVLVARNFDSIVDDSKDVLIEFYAPWCGHCKNLEPKYKELGEKLAGDPNIVIAKMDATANDVPPQYQVSGFPTLYFSPAGQKMNPKRYEGGREVSDFISYLKREATNPLVMQEEPKKKKKKKEGKPEL